MTMRPDRPVYSKNTRDCRNPGAEAGANAGGEVVAPLAIVAGAPTAARIFPQQLIRLLLILEIVGARGRSFAALGRFVDRRPGGDPAGASLRCVGSAAMPPDSLSLRASGRRRGDLQHWAWIRSEEHT